MKKFAATLKITILISVVLILSGSLSGCSDDVSGANTNDSETDGISFTVTGGFEAEYQRAGSFFGYSAGDEYFYQLLIERPANVDWDLIITGSPGAGISDVVTGVFEITDDASSISATFVDKSVSPQRTWTTLYEGMGGTMEILSVTSGVATATFSFSAGRIGDDIPEDERFVDIEGTFQVPVNPQ